MTNPAEQLDLQSLRDKSREDFYFFTKAILKNDWLDPEIHWPLCNDLQDLSVSRRVIVLPRGWLKTTICTISWPIWLACCVNPNLRILIVQNNMVNARKKLKVIREQWEKNGLLRAMYPELLPTVDSTWSGESICLNRSGTFAESTFECIGVGGQSTSRHYNVVIEDDTVAPDQSELGEATLAPTTEDIQKAIGLHKLLSPLLDNPPIDAVNRFEPQRLVVGTRWYEHDLIQHIKDHEPSYKILTRACRENELGVPDPKGKITYPGRFNEKKLEEELENLGPYFFDTLMMNNPVRTGDMIFKSEWIQYYESLPPRQSLYVYTTVDPATDPELSKNKTGVVDYNVVMTCAKDIKTGFIYVLEYFRDRCSPGELSAAIFDHVRTWKPVVVGYEDVAYQKSLDYWLRELMRQHGQFFILEPIHRQGRKSKAVHIMGLQPIFASKSVWLRSAHKELVTELLTFPRGAHDDLVDSLAMQTQLWARTRGVKKDKEADQERNPLSFEGALQNLRNKDRNWNKSVVLAPFHTPSALASMFN